MNFRTTIFTLTLIFGITFSIPSILQTTEGKKISLGLDLQGGLHLLLGINSDEAIHSKIKSIGQTIKHELEKEDVILDKLTINKNDIIFNILDEDDIKKVNLILNDISKDINIENNNNLNYKIFFSEKQEENIKIDAVEKTIETIRNRLDQFGLAEPSVTKQGKYKIVVELPGIKTQEEERNARKLISTQGNLQLMAVDEERISSFNLKSPQQARKYGDIILDDKNNINIKYLLKEIPIITGDQINNANVGFDKNNKITVNFSLNSEGSTLFGDFTAKNIEKRMAIVLDNKVYSAPVIKSRIGGGNVQVTGNFTIEEAKNIVIALKSGALPASILMLEKRSVGPSLGSDSIKSSLVALISGFLLVMIFMVIYYGYSGIIANIALVVNLFVIIAVMSLFGATLTLPGMAGIVLTVGMAVDANVIIIERIRELIEQGKSVQKSIEDGYNNAMRAILDANITTLLTSIILYFYGSGPIKGFAITISIGILASMITAIIGTHGIYDSMLKKIDKNKSLKWFGVKSGGK